jgi:LytS/YehU family sensor histidine kinase
MRLRLGERLAYSIDVAPETLTAAAPPMLLQPLVENAIKHGIEPSDAGGVVGIRTSAENGALVVVIRNTGESLGPEAGLPDPARTGLTNVRRRLAALYAGEGALSLARDRDGATVAILRIPLSVV